MNSKSSDEINLIHRRDIFAKGPFRVEEAEFQLKDPDDGSWGPSIHWLSFERGDSVAAVVFKRSAETLIFVRQFRYPTYAQGDGWIVELVAGMLENGRPGEEAIRAEILEETGCRVSYVKDICSFYSSPGGSSEKIYLFYAEVEEASPGLSTELHDAGDTGIQIVELELNEAIAKLDDGEFHDAKTVIGLQWVRNNVTKIRSGSL